jgi:hypothetical protein
MVVFTTGTKYSNSAIVSCVVLIEWYQTNFMHFARLSMWRAACSRSFPALFVFRVLECPLVLQQLFYLFFSCYRFVFEIFPSPSIDFLQPRCNGSQFGFSGAQQRPASIARIPSYVALRSSTGTTLVWLTRVNAGPSELRDSPPTSWLSRQGNYLAW